MGMVAGVIANYDHTFQTSRQLNLQISTFKEIHRKTVFLHHKVSSLFKLQVLWPSHQFIKQNEEGAS